MIPCSTLDIWSFMTDRGWGTAIFLLLRLLRCWFVLFESRSCWIASRFSRFDVRFSMLDVDFDVRFRCSILRLLMSGAACLLCLPSCSGCLLSAWFTCCVAAALLFAWLLSASLLCLLCWPAVCLVLLRLPGCWLLCPLPYACLCCVQVSQGASRTSETHWWVS